LSEIIPVGNPLNFEEMVTRQIKAQKDDPTFVAEKMIAMELALNEMSQVMKEMAQGCRGLDQRITDLERYAAEIEAAATSPN